MLHIFVDPAQMQGDLLRVTGNADPDCFRRQGRGDLFTPFHGADTAPVQIVLPTDVEQGVDVCQTVHIKVK